MVLIIHTYLLATDKHKNTPNHSVNTMFAENKKKYSESVVLLQASVGGGLVIGGTGFAVRAPSGMVYIVTNSHVCRYLNKPVLSMIAQNEKVRGLVKYIKGDIVKDLCALSGLNIKALKITTITEDSEIFAFSYPNLQHKSYLTGHTVGEFLLTEAEMWETCRDLHGCPLPPRRLFTTIKAVPGCSGSPVLNPRGEVVGVISLSDTRNNLMFGIAVTHKDLKAFLSDL